MVRFVGTILLVVVMVVGGSGQEAEHNKGVLVRSIPTHQSSAPSLATRPNSLRFNFLGAYGADGKFTGLTRHPKLLGVAFGFPEVQPPLRPVGVPEFIDLKSRETVVENYRRPFHGQRILKASSVLTMMRDGVVRFAYGRENILAAPSYVATDSQQRLILSEPGSNAVHVLDGNGRRAFRIACGRNMQLEAPRAVAVDASDNIYVADSARRLVIVFSSDGRFLREIGIFKGEHLFDSPSAIGIDQRLGRLYVLDSAANEVVVLDLTGNPVEHWGKHSAGSAPDFVHPTEIAVGNGKVVVLDSDNTRVQVINDHGKVIRSFQVRNLLNYQAPGRTGLALDHAEQIYVSNLLSSEIRTFSQDGEFLGTFGRPGIHIGEFAAPSGLWIDSADRIYVADTKNGRVQVFQISELGNSKKTSVDGEIYLIQ